VIVPPPSWSSQRRGGALVMRSPDQSMAISYRETLRPLVDIDAAVDRVLAEIPAAIEHVSPTAPLVTREGEHAAIVLATTKGSYHALGFVFADDYYACLHGAAYDEERASALAKQVYDLTMSDVHMLGVRRRRYRYTPPVGWNGTQCGFETTWHDVDATITVYPAWPASVQAGELVPNTPTDIVNARDGLSGAIYDLELRAAHRTLAVLQDTRYVYTLRLDAPTTAKRATFIDVVRSIVPHPQGESPRATDAALVFAHAAD
jgi:hypothetical protein